MVQTSRLRTRRRRAVSVLLVAAALPFAAFTVMRLLGIDGNGYTSSALALLPYATVAALLLAVLALGLRRWRTGTAVLVAVASMAAVLVPRTVAADQPAAAGPDVRILSVNLHLGGADPGVIVDLVRRNEVDVLSLLELTPRAVAALDRAGLFTLLPYRVLQDTPGAAGSGLVARHPLAAESLAGPSKLHQPAARVALPAGGSVEIVAVHAMPAVVSPADWRSDLAGLPPATADLPVRVLAGDFNATLDHAALRELVNTGYADAADQTGHGLQPTWPGELFPPSVTIDHVLVDDRVAVRDYRTFAVPDTDHRAVFAHLSMPASGA
jgi:endonuclease/exonuclease/phosphatase (EEP) superfamily protein YafD